MIFGLQKGSSMVQALLIRRKGLEDDIRAAEGVIYGPGIAD